VTDDVFRQPSYDTVQMKVSADASITEQPPGL
jgi:hypothetical protein